MPENRHIASAPYDRLSVMDSAFLSFEDAHTHMHVGGAVTFEAGPLLTSAGGIDIERIRTYIGSRLHLVPRYRQRLAYVPIEGTPIWVDDGHFDLHYHVRHTSLPRPGNERQLKQLCGQLFSQQLDRRRPLWELWVVEGLEGGRFALINKTHHCMIDGISGVDLVAALLRPTPDAVIEPPPRWTPLAAPAAPQLLRDAVVRQASIPLQLAGMLGDALEEPSRAASQFTERFSAALQTIGTGLQPPAETPLNRPIGPHRRFDWLAFDLTEVKRIKNRLDATVNDVVLATVTGAVRRFLQQRRFKVDGLRYRVAIPVSTRSVEELGAMGNRVSVWFLDLPVDERDPQQRLARIRAATAAYKESKLERGVDALIRLAEWASPIAVTLGARFASWMHPYNLIVTNVPGPQLPLYLLGAQMLAGYPVVPLFENQGLGVAVFSYNGKICLGANADWDGVPDLHTFIEALQLSFDELRAAAAPPIRARRPTRVQQPVRRAAGQR